VVNSLTMNDINEIYELRTILEPFTLERSIPNLTLEDIVQLENLHKKMMQTTDIETYVDLNNQFHNLSLSGAKCKRLHGSMARVSLSIHTDTTYVKPDQTEKSNAAQSKILDAVKEQNIETASTEYAHHISSTHTDLIPLLHLE